ncbi:hypothetical protein HYV80_05630 [Candidatus Woesearchaeota archaeon]|nr:hypothetical protein [Candidatus Woesearchaeota archaeon]
MPKKPTILGEIFFHKHIKDNGDIVDMKIEQVEKTQQYKEGIRYSLSYIRDGKTLIRYDNHAWHPHHKHIKGKRIPYEFKDEWQVIADFEEDLKKFGINP